MMRISIFGFVSSQWQRKLIEGLSSVVSD